MNWPSVPLGEVATIERRGVDPSALPGDTAYLSLEHIERGGRILGQSTVGEAQLSSTKFAFSDRHILFGKLRPNLGKVARPDFSGVCSTDILPIDPGPRLDRAYLHHYLAQPRMVEYAASRTTGANLPRLSPKALTSFAIPLPPLEEQRRIAAILDHADALQAKRHEALDRLHELQQSLFLEFSKQREVAMATVADVAHVQGGLQVTSKRKTLPSEVPYLRVANVFRDRLDLDEVKLLRVTRAELDRTRLVPGDLLVVEGHGNADEVGRVAVWSGEIADCVHQNHLIRVRANPDVMLPQFMSAWLNSDKGRRHLLRAAKTTSGLNTISASNVKSAPVPLVPIQEQRRFTERRAEVTALSRKHVAGIGLLGEATGALSARLFSTAAASTGTGGGAG